MTKSAQRAKWILALLCLLLAFCLAQRSFNLPTAPLPPVNVATADQVDAVGGDKLCAISAKSLHAASPAIDPLMPFLLMVVALMATLLLAKSATGYLLEPLFPPLRRRHLTLCVFRE